MNKEIQIAVVGAGPAGSTAAETAANCGTEVVLIERKSEIGTPVQCGGFLPEAHELQALMPCARLPQTLQEIPERCILQRTRLQRIISPSGKANEFSVAGRVLDRRAFDRLLAHRAARAGVQILPATRASLVGSSLRLSGRFAGSIRPKVIVGADGPSSTISRAMGNRLGEQGICLEYEMVDVDIDPDAAEMYFSARYAPGGYAWIIPMGQDIANVGVGVRRAFMGDQRLPDLLDSFVKEHPIASNKLGRGEVTAVMRGLVPACGSLQEVQVGNMLLAGDAAGHVMATSGGGIPLAVVAGRIAGETAAGQVLGELALREYKLRIAKEFGTELSRSVQIRKIVDMAMRSDRLMNALLAALSPEQMKLVMRAQIPEALAQFGNLRN